MPRDSVVNVTAIATIDKTDLGDHVADVDAALLTDVDRGLRLVLHI